MTFCKPQYQLMKFQGVVDIILDNKHLIGINKTSVIGIP
jgi:hypothetical protein